MLELQKYRIVWFILLLSALGCQREKAPRAQSRKFSSEDLVKVNKYLVKKDQMLISNFVERHSYKMQHTESGLWYGISGTADGTKKVIKSEKGLYALISYKVKLIDGTSCYSSDSLGLKQFLIGKGGVEAGLEEGILKFSSGDSGLLILPPHLAYGLVGDGQKIPGRSILLYEVRLLNLSPVAVPESNYSHFLMPNKKQNE
jgi:FKBP-type peptidyl-prolyl cis-trans isomerase FkpA